MSRSTVEKLAAELEKQIGLYRVPIEEDRWAIVASDCGHSHKDGAVCVILLPHKEGGFYVASSLLEAFDVRKKMALLFAQDLWNEQPTRKHAFSCSEVRPHEWEDMRT